MSQCPEKFAKSGFWNTVYDVMSVRKVFAALG